MILMLLFIFVITLLHFFLFLFMAYASYIIDASKKSKYTMFVKEITVMNFENYFPLWNDLNTAQKKLISDNLITQHVKKGTVIHNGNLDCTGLLLVKSGQLRTYILSNEGREITLYRLFDMDMCVRICFRHARHRLWISASLLYEKLYRIYRYSRQ